MKLFVLFCLFFKALRQHYHIRITECQVTYPWNSPEQYSALITLLEGAPYVSLFLTLAYAKHLLISQPFRTKAESGNEETITLTRDLGRQNNDAKSITGLCFTFFKSQQGIMIIFPTKWRAYEQQGRGGWWLAVATCWFVFSSCDMCTF